MHLMSPNDILYWRTVWQHLLVKVFAKPKGEQEEEIFFYSMMFLVIAAGSGITMFMEVCSFCYVLLSFGLDRAELCYR